MIIKAKVDFKHDRLLAKAGEVYDVPEGPAFYFCANGWAEDVSGKVASGELVSDRVVSLEIHNGVLGHKSSNA